MSLKNFRASMDQLRFRLVKLTMIIAIVSEPIYKNLSFLLLL